MAASFPARRAPALHELAYRASVTVPRPAVFPDPGAARRGTALACPERAANIPGSAHRSVPGSWTSPGCDRPPRRGNPRRAVGRARQLGIGRMTSGMEPAGQGNAGTAPVEVELKLALDAQAMEKVLASP